MLLKTRETEMKKTLKNVSFMILLLQLLIFFGQEVRAQKRIVIDVGHGGKDSGAIGLHGMQEKDIVLAIALEIMSLNKQSVTPLDIYLTRFNDTLISLSDRSKLAKTLKAFVFISLHCNHSENWNARGVEVYVANTMSQYSKESTWWAFRFQAAFNKQLGFESRGVKFANFQVLRESQDFYPAVLLELGFLSNRDENSYFSNAYNIRSMAESILLTINNY